MEDRQGKSLQGLTGFYVPARTHWSELKVERSCFAAPRTLTDAFLVASLEPNEATTRHKRPSTGGVLIGLRSEIHETWGRLDSLEWKLEEIYAASNELAEENRRLGRNGPQFKNHYT